MDRANLIPLRTALPKIYGKLTKEKQVEEETLTTISVSREEFYELVTKPLRSSADMFADQRDTIRQVGNLAARVAVGTFYIAEKDCQCPLVHGGILEVDDEENAIDYDIVDFEYANAFDDHIFDVYPYASIPAILEVNE